MPRWIVFATAMFVPLPGFAVAGGSGEVLAQRFRIADTDSNGMLSRAEAEAVLPRLALHFDAIDVNRDGQISPEEIRAFRRAGRKAGAARRGSGSPGAKFEAYFARADADGDGGLSLEEAERGMPRLAGKFGRIDRDGDGRLTLDELKAWLGLRKSARGG